MSNADEQLARVVAEALPKADADTLAVVTACTGLLACVAYADREFSAEELAHARSLISTIHGLGPEGGDAVTRALRTHVRELSEVHATRFTRTLVELGSRELRVHVLEMLLEIAAADARIDHAEVSVLRQATSSLGLTQDDYNRLQKKHRELLASLRD